MSKSVPIEDSTIVAAMTPPRSKAAFNRAHLIVEGPDGVFVQARAYGKDGRAMGPGLSPDDLRGLIDAEQATELPRDIALAPGTALWVLRHGFPRRDRALQELRVSGLLVHPPFDGPDNAWLCLVNEGGDDAARLRDRWRDEALTAAKAHASNDDWQRAEHEAQVAHDLSRGLDPKTLALLSLAHEQCDRAERAEGILVMARRSRGEEFEAQVKGALGHLRGALLPKPADPSRSDAGLRAVLSSAGLAAYLKPMQARLAPA